MIGIVRAAAVGVVGLGASALTLAILFTPDLSPRALAALLLARGLLGVLRWGALLYLGRRLLKVVEPRRAVLATA